MQHPNLQAFEARLKALFDKVDGYLEERFGARHRLHPARSGRGLTSNPEHDGLFNVGAAFSSGYGSRLGRGYVIEVRMVTLDRVSIAERARIEEAAIKRARRLLAERFPERELRIERDGNLFKIVGDLNVGSV